MATGSGRNQRGVAISRYPRLRLAPWPVGLGQSAQLATISKAMLGGNQRARDNGAVLRRYRTPALQSAVSLCRGSIARIAPAGARGHLLISAATGLIASGWTERGWSKKRDGRWVLNP